MPSCSCLNEKGNKILFRINIWPQPTTIAGLEEAGQGLASQVTRHHTNGLLPIQPHLSPDLHVANWFWIGSYCLYCSGSNLAFCKCQSLLSPVGCVSRSVAVRWNICSKLVWIFFSPEYFSGFAWFPTLNQTDFDRPYCCTDTSPTYSSLTINPCFGHPNHLPKFGHGVFRTLYIAPKCWHPPHHTAGCQNPKDYNLEAFGLLNSFKKVEDAGQVTDVTVHSPKSYPQRTWFHNKWICDVSACLTWPWFSLSYYFWSCMHQQVFYIRVMHGVPSHISRQRVHFRFVESYSSVRWCLLL